MTQYFLSLNRGQVDMGPDQVVEGTSSAGPTTVDFELRISSLNSPTSLDIVTAVEALLRYVQDGRFTTLPFLG